VLAWLGPLAACAAEPASEIGPTLAAEPAMAPWQDDAALYDVHFVDPQTGWAVGQHGTIWHTRDGGDSWLPQRSGVTDALYGVGFVNSREGYAVGGRTHPYADRTLASDSISQAAVLVTRDGGLTWRVQPAHVPALHRVQAFGADEAVAAGRGANGQPAGLFFTANGGRGWEPLSGGAKRLWLAADFLEPGQGVVAGVAGRVARVVDGRFLEEANPLDSAGRSFRDVALDTSGRGWLVGDGGLALTTNDLGHTWQTLDALADRRLSDVDLHAVATSGRGVWLAGSPGHVILHSPDLGKTWQPQWTPVSTPLRRVRFVDPQHGWAVGDLGVILATQDGGATWQVQRGAGRRAAVLAIATTCSGLPTCTLARLAADEGYRTVVHVVSQPQVTDEGTGGSLDVGCRLDQAVGSLGGNAATLAWQFPASDPRFGYDGAAMFAAIDRLNDGRARDRLRDRLVREIRTWQPDVVLLPDPSEHSSQPLDGAVHAVALEALRSAADPTSARHLAELWRLAAWQPRRAYATLSGEARGTHHVAIGAAGHRLGQPLFDLAAEARALLREAGEEPEPAVDLQRATEEFQLVWNAEGPLGGRGLGHVDDLLAGLEIPVGGPARRPWHSLSLQSDPLRAERLAQKRRNLRGLLQHQQVSPAWLGQITQLTADLDANAGAGLLEEMASLYQQQGELALAAEVQHLLTRRYPQHPLADRALLWLVQYYASGEVSHAQAGRGGALPAGPSAAETSGGVRLATAEVSVPADVASRGSSAAMGESPRERRLTRAAQLVETISHTRAWLAQEPALRFPWVVAQRERGFTKSAQRYLLLMEHRGAGTAWHACALAERWLREPQDLPPSLPIANCRRAEAPPHLDGRLDDPIWQTSPAARLRATDPNVKLPTPAEVWFGYDDRFLYVGLRAARARGVDYRVGDVPRTRDADLSAHDRLRLLIDLDRDYTTWYELGVDSRGHTSDRCWDDRTWNPQWYVASLAAADPADGEHPADVHWQVEMAIAWSQLTPQEPQSRHVWAVALDRIVPGVGLASWTGPASSHPGPESFGLLVFE
jgi:photosystem II stability/assembly factor-like uncharacterized protein